MTRFAIPSFPWLLGLAAAVVVISACQDLPNEQRCRNIPAGGCPGQDPSVCIDVTCAAVYTCQPDGTWTFAVDCPGHEGGADAPLAADASDAASPPGDATIDVPGAYGGPGCPDLQAPDCPLGIAAQCSPDCCGCEDLFVCQGGGWNLWGVCVDGGIQEEQ